MDKRTIGSLLSTLLFIIVIILLLPFIFWVAIILLVIFAIFAIYIYFRSRKIAKQFIREEQAETGGFKSYYEKTGKESTSTISPDVIDADFTVKSKEINE